MSRLARSHPLSDELRGLLEGKLGEAVSAAADYAADAIAPSTRAAYIRDWYVFATWCREQGADPNALPTHPVLVAAYIASLAGTIGKSALRGRLAAIGYHHRRRGLTWSGAHPAIREALAGIGRAHGKPVRPSAALTWVEIKRLIASCAQDLAGQRDRALFLVGFAGAFRRSELVGIDVHHLRFEADCLVVHLPRSKGDQAGKGVDVTLPRMRGADSAASDTCPVRALEAWLRRAKIRRGPVFRSVTAHGTLEERLTGAGVRHILLSRAKLAKLTVQASERLSPHGLRAGLITEAYLAGRAGRAGGGAHAARRPVDDARLPQAGAHHRGQPGPPARPLNMVAKPARRTQGGQEGQGAFGEAVGANRDAPAGTDWLLNLLTVSGPAGEVARFRDVARGTGGVPWHLDLNQEEARLFAPMASAGPEARMLARQLREVIAARHDRLLARWREPGLCPFDLHRLVLIPDGILQLGEDDPHAQDWLRAHWGTTQLGTVRIREEGSARRLRRKAEIVYEFRSADWTPWQAIMRLRRDWPKLVLTVRPSYDDG